MHSRRRSRRTALPLLAALAAGSLLLTGCGDDQYGPAGAGVAGQAPASSSVGAGGGDLLGRLFGDHDPGAPVSADTSINDSVPANYQSVPGAGSITSQELALLDYEEPSLSGMNDFESTLDTGYDMSSDALSDGLSTGIGTLGDGLESGTSALAAGFEGGTSAFDDVSLTSGFGSIDDGASRYQPSTFDDVDLDMELGVDDPMLDDAMLDDPMLDDPTYDLGW